MDDAESTPFERAQEGRKHLGGLFFGVVQQQNAAAGPLNPGKRQL